MAENFASYEKTVVAELVRITHTVRVKLNETAGSVKNTLLNVPDNAELSMVYDDDDGVGELVFTEEKEG